jgi:hypothetical protein
VKSNKYEYSIQQSNGFQRTTNEKRRSGVGPGMSIAFPYSFGGTTGSFLLLDDRDVRGDDDDNVSTPNIMFWSTVVPVVAVVVSMGKVVAESTSLCIVAVSIVLLRFPAKHNASLRICCCKSRRSRNKPDANMMCFFKKNCKFNIVFQWMDGSIDV